MMKAAVKGSSKPSEVRAKKSLGQNFLMHQAIAERIADAAPFSGEDTVFEIGPGKGMLTRALLRRARVVIALEADRELTEHLQREFSREISLERLDLREGDIRTFDPDSLPASYVIVANIPYYLTGEIIRTFLTAKNQPSSMTLLVQKEVAERIARAKKESLLSLSIKAFGTPKYAFTVPKGAFVPAPKVDSAVLTIRDISRANFASPGEEARFFELIRAGFASKRKKLAGNLARAGFANLPIPENARAEDLALADWLRYTHLTG